MDAENLQETPTNPQDNEATGNILPEIILEGTPTQDEEEQNQGHPFPNPFAGLPMAVNQKTKNDIPETLTAVDLSLTEYPKPKSIVKGLFYEGLTLLVAKPKEGKTELTTGISVAVSSGTKALGEIEVTKGTVLYLALEDTERMLKDRLAVTFPIIPPSPDLHFVFKWPTIDEDGIEALRKWLKGHPETRLVVIDTLARIRGRNAAKVTYAAEYELISSFKKLADDREIAIVILHHLRKNGSIDPLDVVAGTTGLTAAADYIIILSKSRSSLERQLYITGRGIEEQRLVLKYEGETRSFKILGKAEEYILSQQRQDIISYLRSCQKPLQLKDISEAVGKKKPAVHKLLTGLIKVGVIYQPKHGFYELVKKTSENGESSGNAHSNQQLANNINTIAIDS